MKKTEAVAILGLSENSERYSYLAYKKLLENKYSNLYGITPKVINIPDINVVHSISEIEDEVHTLTIYLDSKKITPIIDEIINLRPKRIILNPGTENEELILKAKEYKIEVIVGCTLVLLNTNQF